MARIRANTDRLAVEREETTRRALEQATKEEIGAARRVYGGVHQPRWFEGREADVQRRFGAALVTAHAMAGVDPVARVAQEHLLREARARYSDADAWIQAAVLGYTEAMAELRDRDEAQGRADRAEESTASVSSGPGGEDAHLSASPVEEVGLRAWADRGAGSPAQVSGESGRGGDTRVMFEQQAAGAQARAERDDEHSLDDLDRALDEWSREVGDRARGDDLERRAHQVGDEAVVE